MMNGDANAIFIDTNVLVYANILHAPFHQPALRAIQSYEQAGCELWISRQILREYLATLTRPQSFSQPIDITILVSQVRQFEQRFHVADDQRGVTEHLLKILEQTATGGKQIHDANIIATMHMNGIHRILTHNTSDFARFTSTGTIIPLIE